MHNVVKIIFAGSIACLLIGCRKPDTTSEKTMPSNAKSLEVKKVVGVARIEPGNGLLDLTAGMSGRVITILVSENDSVKKDEVIATADASVESAQLKQALAKLTTHLTSIKLREAEEHIAKATYENVVRNHRLQGDLFNANATTRETLDDWKYQLVKSEKDYEKAKADVQQTKSKTAEFQADVEYYKTLIAQKRIEAPVDGVILSLDLKNGQYVSNTQLIGELAPTGPLVAVTEVDELFAERIHNGLSAAVYSQSTGEKLGTGTVTFAASYLKKKSLFEDESTQEDRRVREVRIQLDPSSKVLIGSRVDCEITFD
jgi:HlyD family secretion protein